MTQLHDALLITLVDVTKLIGCTAELVHELQFSWVQYGAANTA